MRYTPIVCGGSWGWVVAMVLMAGGCHIPDVTSFHRSTVQLEQAIVEIHETTRVHFVSTRPDPARLATFDESWRTFLTASRNMAAYTSSLKNLYVAKANAVDNARETILAFNKATDAVGAGVPVKEDAGEIIEMVFDGLASTIAYHKIRSTSEKIDPHVETLIALQITQLGALRKYVVNGLEGYLIRQFDKGHKWTEDYEKLVARETGLVAFHNVVVESGMHLAASQLEPGAEPILDPIISRQVLEAIPHPERSSLGEGAENDKKHAKAVGVANRAHANEAVRLVAEGLERYALLKKQKSSEYQAYLANRARLSDEMNRLVGVIDSSVIALREWKTAHGTMVRGFKTGGQVDVEYLSRVVDKITKDVEEKP